MVFAMPAKTPSLGSWFLGALCVIAGPVTLATAHPHMWVDLESRIVLHDDASPASIHQKWLFDDFFSTALIEEAGLHPDGVGAGIQQQITEIMVNLQPYDYFTVIKRGDDTLPLALVGDVTAGIRENRVWMDFTVAIESHVDLAAQNFSYAIFDPTYYIEMFHREGETIAFDGDAPAGCGTEIVQPNPSADAIALSQSASLDANPDDTIGRLFAETVHVKCQ
jgi:ABC-type uncharacterized transport system substrate-binding protein